jgi:two-component system, response regulator
MKSYVLLVEDDPDDLHLIKRAFAINRIPNELVVLTDGAQACEFLFESERGGRGYPHVILLNWALPKIPASEVLDRIRNDPRTHPIPTVVLTSGKHNGFRKPPHFVDFVEAVRQVGLYWLVLNESPPRAGSATQNILG